MLLYIHVPFCRRKCRYCAFYSNPLTRSGDEMAVYLSALYAELGQWGRRLGRVPVESVFFGGGTPSLLDPDQLEGVLDCVGRTFEVLPGAEISMEANPDSLHTAEKASGFLAAGVNRISLGVQSLHDGMLETLGRLHRANAAREAFRAIPKVKKPKFRWSNLPHYALIELWLAADVFRYIGYRIMRFFKIR